MRRWIIIANLAAALVVLLLFLGFAELLRDDREEVILPVDETAIGILQEDPVAAGEVPAGAGQPEETGTSAPPVEK